MSNTLSPNYGATGRATAPSPTIQNSAEQLAQELTPRRAVSYLRVSTREQARRGGRGRASPSRSSGRAASARR